MGTGQQSLLSLPVAGGVVPPTDIPGIWEWWEPSREAYANGAEITTLVGQANARNMTGFAATFIPTMATGVLNGLAVANCPTGTKSWLGPNMSALTAAHLFAVVKVDTDPADNAMWRMGGTGNDSRYPFSDGVVYEQAFSSVRHTVANPAVSLAAWRVYEVSSITNEWICRIDGTQLGTTKNPNTVSGASSPRVGCTNTGSMKGQIAGIYVYDTKLSSTNRDLQIAYVNDRFALSSS
jgi:hypothetical protein